MHNNNVPRFLSGRGGFRCNWFEEPGQHVLHERHSAVPQVKLCTEDRVCGRWADLATETSSPASVDPGPHIQSSLINIVWGTVRGITA